MRKCAVIRPPLSQRPGAPARRAGGITMQFCRKEKKKCNNLRDGARGWEAGPGCQRPSSLSLLAVGGIMHEMHGGAARGTAANQQKADIKRRREGTGKMSRAALPADSEQFVPRQKMVMHFIISKHVLQ